jgi:hypothetical protein
MIQVTISSPFMQELCTGHALMMQCAAAAERLLDQSQPIGSPAPQARAREEAVRMGGLFARLGDGLGRAFLLRGRLPAAALDRGVPAPAAARPTPAAPAPRLHAAPGARRGRLKNGNPSGDYLKSPRCGARTRAGRCCRQPAMANGRCRMHGGLSTGPRTPAGIARCRATRLVHGCRTRAHLALRSRAVHAARRLRALTRDLSAGHGLHRPESINRGDAKMQSTPVAPASSSSAPSRLRVESTARKTTLSAGHGLHRSFRDHLHSSALTLSLTKGIGGLKSIQPNGQPAAGHGLHRSVSRGVTTPAGLR